MRNCHFRNHSGTQLNNLTSAANSMQCLIACLNIWLFILRWHWIWKIKQTFVIPIAIQNQQTQNIHHPYKVTYYFHRRNLSHNRKFPCQKSLADPVKFNLLHSFSDESSSNPEVRQNSSNALNTCQQPNGWQISPLEVGSSRLWTCSTLLQPELEISLWEQLQMWSDPKHCSVAINILLPCNLTDLRLSARLFLLHIVPLLEIQCKVASFLILYKPDRLLGLNQQLLLH